MAFEALTDKFSSIIKRLKGETYLTEKNMDEMLKSIRLALLDADVNYKVVKEFVNNVKEKAVGQEVYKKVNPSQMITKIVHDELEALLGSTDSEIKYPTTANAHARVIGEISFLSLINLITPSTRKARYIARPGMPVYIPI